MVRTVWEYVQDGMFCLWGLLWRFVAVFSAVQTVAVVATRLPMTSPWTITGCLLVASLWGLFYEHQKRKTKKRFATVKQIRDEFTNFQPPQDLISIFAKHVEDFYDEREVVKAAREISKFFHDPFEMFDLTYKGMRGKRLRLLQDARISNRWPMDESDLFSFVENDWAAAVGLRKRTTPKAAICKGLLKWRRKPIQR